MQPLRRHDVLAAYLLFATVALSVLGLVLPFLEIQLAVHRGYLPATFAAPIPWPSVALKLLQLGAHVGAQLLVVLGFAAQLYFSTNLPYKTPDEMLTEEYFFNSIFRSLLVLLQQSLVLAALALMFWPSREAKRQA